MHKSKLKRNLDVFLTKSIKNVIIKTGFYALESREKGNKEEFLKRQEVVLLGFKRRMHYA
jgi:hypothetical protein